MYLNYYNMAKAPFHITPDPEFLYLSPSHKEALGAIIYCISKKKGFVAVTGEVGTGKTTIIRSYLARSNRNVVKPIYLFNPAVRFSELLKTIFQELGVEPCNENIYDMVQQLHTVLIREYEQRHNIVLIIDEAQNMPIATFERLRILSNLETPKDKLLQIILVGQPELTEKLAGKELRQLNQRLAVRATLLPLSSVESRDYILFRLAKVTPSPREIFSPQALKRIIRAAKGSPRMINILCDNALVAGFGYQEPRITGGIVKQVIADFEGKARHRFFSWQHASLAGVFLLVAAALAGMHQLSLLTRLSSGQNDRFPASIETTALSAQAQTAPAIDLSQTEDAAPAMDLLQTEDAAPAMDLLQTEDAAPSSPKIGKQRGIPADSTTPAPPAPSGPAGQDRASIILVRPEEKRWKRIKVEPTVRTVKKGENLSRICLDVYGFVNNRIIQAVKDGNPDILDADLIFTGDRIFFPAPLDSERRRADYQGGQRK